MKVKKNYYLSEEIIGIIEKVKKENEFRSEVDTITFIIREHENRKTLAEELVETFNNKNKNWMDRLRIGISVLEKNSNTLINVANTRLILDDVEWCSHIDIHKSPVIKQIEEERRKRIQRAKQIKDNKGEKNNV